MTKVHGHIIQLNVKGSISQLNVRGSIVQGGYVFAFAPAEAPTLLNATTINENQIDLGWTINSTRHIGHAIERTSVPGGLTGWIPIDIVLGAIDVYSDTTCIKGTLYYYRVRAYRYGIYSDYSNVDSATTFWTWIIPITGQTAGIPTAGTMVISCTEDVTITKTGDVTISVAQANDSIYRKHTVTINCPNNGSGTVVIPDRTKVVSLGNHNGTSNPTINFYAGDNITAPILTWDLNDIPATCLKIRQATSYTVILPTTGNIAFPTGLIYLWLAGANINWTYNGAMPTSLSSLTMVGHNIAWTYTGALPTGLTYLLFEGNNIAWTYTGALPTGLTNLSLIGTSINWTGLDISGTGNIISFNLANYRIGKMSSADMVTLLTNLTNRVGGLPATVTINDYLDWAAPPVAVTDAVDALKIAKSITTCNLGA